MDRGSQLIQKYLLEGLTEAERFELEKIALDDDFVADAWEGVVLSDKLAVNHTIARLESKVNRKSVADQKKQAKVIPLHRRLWPYAIAASFALFVSLFFFLRSDSIEDLMVPATAIVLEETDEINPELSTLPVEPEAIDKATDLVPNNAAGTKVPEKEVRDLAYDQPDETQITSPGATDDIATTVPSLAESPLSIVTAASEEEIRAETSILPQNPHSELARITDETPTSLAIASEVATSISDQEQSSNAPPIQNSLRPTARSKKSNETPGLTQAFSKKVNPEPSDSPQPKIGFEKYRSHLQSLTTITREELFMYGLKTDFEVRARFKLDTNGIPQNIEIINVPESTIKQKLIALLKIAGPWLQTGDDWINYNFMVPISQ